MKIIRYIFIRHFYHISFIFNLTNRYFRSTDPLHVGRIDLFRYSNEVSNLTYFMPEVQVACVYGGANMEKQAKRLAEGCQIVVATPGRLMDHYKHHSIDISHVTQIVLDEADEMLNMGFYKDVRHIIEMMKARKALSMFSSNT